MTGEKKKRSQLGIAPILAPHAPVTSLHTAYPTNLFTLTIEQCHQQTLEPPASHLSLCPLLLQTNGVTMLYNYTELTHLLL